MCLSNECLAIGLRDMPTRRRDVTVQQRLLRIAKSLSVRRGTRHCRHCLLSHNRISYSLILCALQRRDFRLQHPTHYHITASSGRFITSQKTLFSTDKLQPCVSSGFRHCVNEIFALLGCYAVLIGSYLPTFWDGAVCKS